jgi:hypothetical protein
MVPHPDSYCALGWRGLECEIWLPRGAKMLRAVLLSGVALLGLASYSASADTVYYCVPDEPRVAASNRLVSVEVTLKPDGEFASVVYRAANGAIYDRGQQYEAKNINNGAGQYWAGTLRINRNVGMLGSFRRVDGRLVYLETVHDNLQGGKIVSQVVSNCDGGQSTYAVAPPTPTPVPATPSPAPQEAPPPQPNAEAEAARSKLIDDAGKEYDECIRNQMKEIVPFSNEGAETIAQVITTKCADKEEHFVEVGMAIYGVSRKELENTLHDALETRRKNIVADVVTFRAELSKALLSRQKNDAAPASNTGQGL